MSRKARNPGIPFLAEEADRGVRVEVVTPEGVPVAFHVAPAGDRVAALVLDLVIVLGSLFLALLAFALAGVDSGWLWAAWILAFFLGRNFYFAWFELRWQGMTPGKRFSRIRVVDAAGGPLTAEAILVRNLTRELEVFTPVMVLIFARHVWPGAPGWAVLAAILWVLLFALLPLFNSRRLRIGDLVAGTMVVRHPKAVLLPDLGSAKAERAVAAAESEAAEPAPFSFTDAQLDVYGILELQVLEEVLRRHGGRGGDRKALKVVADRIAKKVDWDGDLGNEPEPFLRSFYAALRARLESRMLLGKRKEDKHSR